ncbi:MarR family winged helix-turn-helix transcriptional regulator [Salinivibrio sharmensis]|uniref:MarR family transcriptional regulator n=1 Tax=Salinivibrio sharmensis TaxID=390883 RepID=A0ABX3KE50_9GAMM|nr:MarR family winged helix-turn-helix transcriptional regulator [Salinivibrio sharmensis]OOE87029.1 hypothetical protein BZG74_11760 [Salinivibrio sharmensis]
MEPFPSAACQAFKKQILAFRALVSQEFHPVQMMIFLDVINQPKGTVTASYVQHAYGVSQVSASRHCRALTKRVNANRAGHDLCYWQLDDYDFRTKVLVLTEKGEQVAEEMRQHFTR